MGVQPPFLYDAVGAQGPRSPYKDFDPRAASRASFQTSRAPPRPKQDGPLVSFNQHPDSYLIMPYGNISATPMSPSVKKWIKWMRIVQLVFRCLQMLAACGLLVLMILIRNVDDITGYIMRIVPGIAILHTVYGIYHLARKPSGRTPASSASYMLFSSFCDCSILPFYAFSALVARTRQAAWTTVLTNQELVPTFSKVVFLVATSSGGMHLVTLAISLYLAVTFRKITKLPPDMNPLEDNLTSRHKRSKSSISTMTTNTSSTKRLSTPLEAKRSSGAPYEDLSRPPTIPFFHTRTQSTSSFSTYKSTEPPSSRNGPDYDARSDLPSNRRYQPLPNPGAGPGSARSSMIDIKRSSYAPATPPKRASYQEVPTSDRDRISMQSNKGGPPKGKSTEGWYASDSLSKTRTRPRTPGNTSVSPKKSYTRLHQRHDSGDDISTFSTSTFATPHPNPLDSNPSTPTPPKHGHRYNLSRDSPLSEITNNNTSERNAIRNSRRVSGDITNLSSELISSQNQNSTHPHRQSPTRQPAPRRYVNEDDVSALSDSDDTAITDQIEREQERGLTPAPLRNSELAFKSKYYGELKPGTPPIMIGPGAGTMGQRQISSGNDFGGYGAKAAGSKFGKREVSGKVAEEGRGFGARFRKGSGM